jgi:predicted nucleic-acid-binding Zn-ribbon protein
MIHNAFVANKYSNAMKLQINTYSRANQKCNYSEIYNISMGPVTSAVVLYIAERIITRILKKQVFRKGVIRKLQRLTYMIFEWHIIHEILCDILEDV